MVEMKYNIISTPLLIIFFGLGPTLVPPFLAAILTAKYGIELGFLPYVISIIYFVSIVKFLRSFQIILNDEGIGRRYTIYIFYYPVYKENFLVPWNKVSRISYANFAFDVDSTELTLWEKNMCFKNRKTFHITFGLTNYKEGIAYIVEKVSKGVTKGVVLEFLKYCDMATAYKLEKMGILEAKEKFRAKMGMQRRAKKTAEKKAKATERAKKAAEKAEKKAQKALKKLSELN
jgi:hypothetical protein